MASAQDFELRVLPHLHAALNLARWLVQDEQVAEDMVQEAFLRAFRYFGSLRGEEARPWVLGIVRNNCYSWLEDARRHPRQVTLDEELADTLAAPQHGQGLDPAAFLDQECRRRQVDAAIRSLPPPFREVIILRELEELSYAEIATIASIPLGTVMSRLSRARQELKAALALLSGDHSHD